MSEHVLRLLAAHGPLLVFAAALLSSIGLPVPGTLTLLAAGSFAASGEMNLAAVLIAAFVGAVAGDLVGFGIGARAGQGALDWAGRHGMGQAIARARDFSDRRGDAGNFLCRWLVSPIAPAVNLISGLIGVAPGRFLVFAAAGEVVWTALYVGLGYGFGRSISVIARTSGDLGLFLVAATAAVVFGLRLRRRSKLPG